MSAMTVQCGQTPEDQREPILDDYDAARRTSLECGGDDGWEPMSWLGEDPVRLELCAGAMPAWHEAGHVVAGVAVGMRVDFACVGKFDLWPDRARTVFTWSSTWVDDEHQIIVDAAGVQGALLWFEQKCCPCEPGEVRFMEGRRPGSDGERMEWYADQMGVDRRTCFRAARRAARDILVANDATLRTVAEVLMDRMCVGGKDLARLTASVERVAPPERPAANGKPHRRPVAVQGS